MRSKVKRVVYWIITAMTAIVAITIGVGYYVASSKDSNIKKVMNDKLNKEKTVKLLGQPDSSGPLHPQEYIPECGPGGAEVFFYSFPETIFLLRLEDTMYVVFDMYGEQCDFDRTAI